MNTNSPSETLWDILHGAEALLLHGGFVPPYPKYSASRSFTASDSASEPLPDILARYSDRLALGSSWPQGKGSLTPKAVILSENPLTSMEEEFVRSWFENPRVKLNLSEDFWIQPLPPFAGDEPPFAAFVKEVLASLHPKVLLSLGEVPARLLLGAPMSLSTLRSSDYLFAGYPMVTTQAPSYFFAITENNTEERTAFKSQVWKDLQRLLGKIRYA